MPDPPFRTPLCPWHEAHGGRMVDFAGWRMPVQYASIVDEHVATPSAAGMFAVSHMGRLTVTGPGSRDWLESLPTRRRAPVQRVNETEGMDSLSDRSVYEQRHSL